MSWLSKWLWEAPMEPIGYDLGYIRPDTELEDRAIEVMAKTLAKRYATESKAWAEIATSMINDLGEEGISFVRIAAPPLADAEEDQRAPDPQP